MEKKVRRALRSTSNRSASGPDEINYKLLKVIQDTWAGQAVIRDVAHHLLQGTLLEEWKEMRVVMISKIGKDNKQIKG